MVALLITAMPSSIITGATEKDKVFVESIEKEEDRYVVQKEEMSNEPEVIEVSDLDSFVQAVKEVTDEDDLNPSFQSKRLVVKSPNGFDPCGAVNIIQGYDQMFVLTYETQEDAKAAYEYLKTIPYLSVEADIPFHTNTMNVESNVRTENPISNEAETEITDISTREHHAVTVAVLDTGYDIAGNDTTRIKEGIDVSGTGTVQDVDGHGTQMANIIRDNTNENVSVLPVCVTDEEGCSSSLKIYLGILVAMQENVEIINISMCSYKPADGFMVEDAIQKAYEKGIFVVTAAGNYMSNVENFVPANIDNAIVVSAVNGDKTFATYSNFGTTVDYSAYGEVETKGFNGETVTASGTSVSAAIVSAYIGQIKSKSYERSMNEIIAWIDGNVLDVDSNGWDEYYGKGMIEPETIENLEKQPEQEAKICELLKCDWKNISDAELDTYIGYATNIQRRIFIDRLSDAELAELLARNTMFSRKIVYYEGIITGEEELKNSIRMHDTLYNILMSDAVSDEYELQRTYNNFNSDIGSELHVYYWGKKDVSCVKLDTSANTSDAVIYCYLEKAVTDNSFNGKIYFSIDEGNSAFDFSDVKGTTKEVTDSSDSGNINTIRIRLKNVKVEKPQGFVVNYSSSKWNETGSIDHTEFGEHYYYTYKYQVKDSNDATHRAYYSDGRWHGGFWQLGSASGDHCKSKTITTSFDIGSRDLNEEKTGITYRFPLKEHVLNAGDSIVADTAATCLKSGQSHVEHTYECSICDKKWTVSDEPFGIPALGHDFENVDWFYGDTSNIIDGSNVTNGVRWHQCKRNCWEDGWQKDFQYYQHISYSFMDEDGNYPGYADHVNGYYDMGSFISSCNYIETPDSIYQAAIGGTTDYTVGGAVVTQVSIPRKKYSVEFVANNVSGGFTEPHTDVCCGKTFKLNKNGFKRNGYKFKGWSKSIDDATVFKQDGASVSNLSMMNGDTVILYAVWEPEVYTITLDNQGADEAGTKQVIENYGNGYYEKKDCLTTFVDNKIEVPKKMVQEENLFEGEREQLFLGYYTRKNGAGYQMIERDGTLIANINNNGDYKYFTSDGTVYAAWEDMYAIQFSDNLTPEDLEIVGRTDHGDIITQPVKCPDTQWKEKGEIITINYEPATVQKESFTDIYRFKGWSLTPEISSDDEMILSNEKTSYTFSADEDVTLYAQWDTSFMVTYVGNEQSEGIDYLDEVKEVTGTYTFNPNKQEQVALLQNDAADYFKKTIEKPTVDIATGEATDENGVPYTEEVAYSFQGWSMYNEKVKQKEHPSANYSVDSGVQVSKDVIEEAKEVAKDEPGKGLTFGKPVTEYGSFNAAHNADQELIAGTKGVQFNELTMEDAVKGYLAQVTDKPFVNMYAIWDEYPQIIASDLYFPLSDAQNGILTEEYLLDQAVATDEELKSDTNIDGRLKNGEDTTNKTRFTIVDYQTSDFVGAEGDVAMTITYRAEDAVGNETTKMVTVHLVDTSAKEYDKGMVRFISEKHIDTLSEKSIWRTGEYATKLAKVLGNSKTGEEYTTVTPVQQILGVQPVKKPGSGTWNQVVQVWKFTHEEVLAVHEYVEANGLMESQEGFLSTFGSCRMQ